MQNSPLKTSTLSGPQTAKVATEDPGRRLRKIREQMHLKYRDVEEASQQIARNRGNQEFLVGLSRLADIENKGTVPSLYRLYSLCVIYGLNFETVLTWFGIDTNELALDAARLSMRQTRTLDFAGPEYTLHPMPLEMEGQIDLTRTLYLNPYVRRWGKLAFSALGALDVRRYRYGFIGTDDWFMYPLLPPGCFVQIDETARRLGDNESTTENDRPIYFVEHRDGYRCGWCTKKNGYLILQPHPASSMQIELFRFPGEVDVIGQVVGVAKRMDQARRRHIRS